MKSEPGFTPGPWFAAKDGHDSWCINGDGWGLANVTSIMRTGGVTEGSANARLIAAAPELYAAVETLIAAITPLHNAHFQIERECISDKDVEDAQAAAREAELVLAKARGEHHEK